MKRAGVHGYYIVFEGIKGSGKKDQTTLLNIYLNKKGIKSIIVREPEWLEGSEDINKILEDKDYDFAPITRTCLYSASRAETFRQVIIPKLDEGFVIVSARSALSTKAHQGFGSLVNKSLIDLLNRETTFGISPDLIFIIDRNPETILDIKKDKFDAKSLGYYKRVREGYLNILEENKDKSILLPYNDNYHKTHLTVVKYVEEKLFNNSQQLLKFNFGIRQIF